MHKGVFCRRREVVIRIGPWSPGFALQFAANMADMVFVGFDGAALALHFNTTDKVGHLAFVKDFRADGIQEREQAGETDDIGAEIGFEYGVAGEHDEGMKIVIGQIEQGLERLDVAVVLAQRVLEPGFLLENLLGPLALVGTAEDPAGVVLGFDDEDAGGGDQDVVNLGGAIGGWQGDVVEQEVGTVQSVADGFGNQGFAEILAVPTPLDAGDGGGSENETEHEGQNDAREKDFC